MLTKTGEALLALFHARNYLAVDTGLGGTTGESVFNSWLQRLLPLRYQVVSGAIVSVNHNPGTQRDCVVFDRHELAPLYGGELGIEYPIEGVLASIEVNVGPGGPGSQKLEGDLDKLSDVGRRFGDAMSPPWRTVLNKLPGTPPEESGRVEIRDVRKKPGLYLFAENTAVTLKGVAGLLEAHNLGVTASHEKVDAAFVLNRGVVLHTRGDLIDGESISSQDISVFPVEAWEVLVLLQTFLLKRAFIHGAPADMDRYFSDPDYLAQYLLPKGTVCSSPCYRERHWEDEPLIANA